MTNSQKDKNLNQRVLIFIRSFIAYLQNVKLDIFQYISDECLEEFEEILNNIFFKLLDLNNNFLKKKEKREIAKRLHDEELMRWEKALKSSDYSLGEEDPQDQEGGEDPF